MALLIGALGSPRVPTEREKSSIIDLGRYLIFVSNLLSIFEIQYIGDTADLKGSYIRQASYDREKRHRCIFH
jgi:hypothetical protein